MILKFSHTQSIFQHVAVVATTATTILIGVNKPSDVAHQTTSTKFSRDKGYDDDCSASA